MYSQNQTLSAYTFTYRKTLARFLCMFIGASTSNLYASTTSDDFTDTDNDNYHPTTELDTITITAEKDEPEYTYNHIQKDSEILAKQQVSNIRDLTRYDAGIAVNEQGQGASAGYSMRGVDRNRVAITVDGMSQAQVFSPGGNYNQQGEYGGAINEIEYENITAVDIQKGSASVLAGNGAMGGAVMFESKTPEDVLENSTTANPYTFQAKTNYTSKDKRLMNSVAMAGETESSIKALVQYTHRQGHEIQSHQDTESQTLSYWYNPKKGIPGVSDADQEQFTKTYDAKDVWGPSRAVANPMDYESKSLYSSLAYDLSDNHRFGLSYELTKQDYNTDDLSQPVFSLSKSRFDTKWTSVVGADAYKWMRATFKDNNHETERLGFDYTYTPPDEKKLPIDRLKVSIANQKIDMDNTLDRRYCAKNMDRACWPTDLGGQQANILQTGTHLEESRLAIKADKQLVFKDTKHTMGLNAGVSDTDFSYDKSYKAKLVNWTSPWNPSKKAYVPKKEVIESAYHNGSEPATGKHYFIALTDNIDIGDKVTLPLGVRIDNYKYDSDSRFVPDANYNTQAWQAGIVYTPVRFLEFAAQASSGFRVPSYNELYGSEILFPGDLNKNIKTPPDTDLQPEKSLNKEIGITLTGDVGHIKLSAFEADYEDLIGLYVDKNGGNGTGWHTYANTQDAYTRGYDIEGFLDLNEVNEYFPEGLSTTLVYSVVKPSKVEDKLDPNSTNFINSSFVLDTIQPARLVWGIDYEAPSFDWGVNAYLTHSFEKKADEVTKKLVEPIFGDTKEVQSIKTLSDKWTTVDVTAWKTFDDRYTLRAGIYNLFDEKYTQWESLRQLGTDGISTTGTLNINDNGMARLSAPGRNYFIALELKY